jgi:tRNA A37 threonylcarbamoyltransferase TsaD
MVRQALDRAGLTLSDVDVVAATACQCLSTALGVGLAADKGPDS